MQRECLANNLLIVSDKRKQFSLEKSF